MWPTCWTNHGAWTSSSTVISLRASFAYRLLFNVSVTAGVTIYRYTGPNLAIFSHWARSTRGCGCWWRGRIWCACAEETSITLTRRLIQARHVTVISWRTILTFCSVREHCAIVEGSGGAWFWFLCLLFTIMSRWTGSCINCRGCWGGVIWATSAEISRLTWTTLGC